MTALERLKDRAYKAWRESDVQAALSALHAAVSRQNEQEARLPLRKLQAKILREAPPGIRTTPRVTYDFTGACEVSLACGEYEWTNYEGKRVVIFHGDLRDYWRETLR